jgi:type IV pilus assembly protein PilF
VHSALDFVNLGQMFRIVAVISFLLLGIGCTHQSAQLKERAQLHLELGISHLTQGNYPAALTELTQAEQLDPKNAVIENNLGLAYTVRNRYKEADMHFHKALELDPKYSDARANLARLLIDQKMYEAALAELTQVENDLTYPMPEKALSLKGMVYFDQGKFKKAEEYLSRAMNVRRDDCVTTNYYGRTLLEERKLDEAVGILDLAVENCRTSKFEEPLFFSAMAYYSLGDKEKSKARARELVSEYPLSQYANKAKGLMKLLE